MGALELSVPYRSLRRCLDPSGCGKVRFISSAPSSCFASREILFLHSFKQTLDVHATWILVIFYGGTTAASVIPCIATVWGAPPPGAILSDPTMVALTDGQK